MPLIGTVIPSGDTCVYEMQTHERNATLAEPHCIRNRVVARQKNSTHLFEIFTKSLRNSLDGWGGRSARLPVERRIESLKVEFFHVAVSLCGSGWVEPIAEVKSDEQSADFSGW